MVTAPISQARGKESGFGRLQDDVQRSYSTDLQVFRPGINTFNVKPGAWE
jgi:hypothetical protein